MSQIHPRVDVVKGARRDLESKVQEWSNQYSDELTDAEMLLIVGEVLNREIGDIAKYMIRNERHPDNPEMPGGLKDVEP